LETGCSFPYAEAAEDQVEDVIGGGSAGDFVERPQGAVKVEEQHFVRNPVMDGGFGGGKPG